MSKDGISSCILSAVAYGIFIGMHFVEKYVEASSETDTVVNAGQIIGAVVFVLAFLAATLRLVQGPRSPLAWVGLALSLPALVLMFF